MKIKIVTLTIMASVLIVATVAMANNAIFEANFEIPTDFEIATDFDFISDSEIATEDTFETEKYNTAIISADKAEKAIEAVDLYIKSHGFEDADRKRIKNRFISTLTNFTITQAELDEINKLVNLDFDIEKVLDIYEFVRWADCDMSMLEEIYRAGEKHIDEKFWIYNTYDRLFERKEDMLSLADVTLYIESGLTIDEILGAYELSFAGSKTTKEMLAERLDGTSWNIIAAPVISSKPETIENAPEMSIGDILKYKAHSVRIRRDVSDIIAVSDGKITLKPDIEKYQAESLKTKRELTEKFDAEIPAGSLKATAAELPQKADSKAFRLQSQDITTDDDLIEIEQPEVE